MKGEIDHVCKAQQVGSIKSFHWNLCGPLIKGTRTAFELKIVTSLFSAKNLERNKELVEGNIGLFWKTLQQLLSWAWSRGHCEGQRNPFKTVSRWLLISGLFHDWQIFNPSLTSVQVWFRDLLSTVSWYVSRSNKWILTKVKRKHAAPSEYPQDIPKSAIKLFLGHLCPVPLHLWGKLT